MDRNTTVKGTVSELKVITAYVDAGFRVLLPFGNSAPYDLAIDLGPQVLKVQVKTGRLRDGCVVFPMRRYSGHSSQGKLYGVGEIDIFAVYCPDNQHMYAVPLSGTLIEGRLRETETKNNQKQKIRWAADFTFEHHLKTLKKEVVELVGIEPTTSTVPLLRSPS